MPPIGMGNQLQLPVASLPSSFMENIKREINLHHYKLLLGQKKINTL